MPRLQVPIAMAFALSIFFIGSSQPGAIAASPSLVRVEMDQDTISLDVSPDGDGKGSFSGRIYLAYPNNPLIEYVEVTLDPDSDSHIIFQMEEYVFTLSESEPEAFISGNLSVPMSSSSSLEGGITIGGSARVYPLGTSIPVESDTISIDILPYYGAIIYFDTPFGKMSRGEERTFDLRVNNTGNAPDTFTLRISNQEELRSQGIVTEIGTPGLDLEEGGSVVVPIKLRADGADRGNYLVQVEVISAGKGTGVPEPSKGAFTLTVERRVISFLQDTVFSSLYFIYGTVVAILLIVAVSALLISRVRRRRRGEVYSFERMDPGLDEGR